MPLNITPWPSPEPALFRELIQQKLQTLGNHIQIPPTTSAPDASQCYLLKTISETRLVAAHPASGEQALIGALQCLQQQALPIETQVILLSSTAPPALAWLSQHHALHWCRCQVLAVDTDYGILIEDTENRLFVADEPLSHARLQRTATPAPVTNNPSLTQEEQQFFSHL